MSNKVRDSNNNRGRIMIYIKSFRYKNVYILLYPDGSYLTVPAEDYIIHDLTSLSYHQVKEKYAITDPTYSLK